MSHLRIAITHIAAGLPAGDPTRRKLLEAVVAARHHENPGQRAIWNAWDAMSGTERVREFDSFEGATSSFAMSVESGPDELMGTFYDKAAEGIEKNLRTLDRQSRSWRTAYNLWLEGREVNTDRIVADMAKSLKMIRTIRDVLVRMGKLKSEFPESWDDVSYDYEKAMPAASAAISAFENAIGVLKSGGW